MDEGEGSPPRRPRTKKSASEPLDVKRGAKLPSLAIRHDRMTRKHLRELEAEKRGFDHKIGELQARIDQLLPENARLQEALDAEKTYNLVSTLLNTIGSVLIGYATFAGKLSERIAALGLGLVVAAVILQVSGKIRHRSGSQKGS